MTADSFERDKVGRQAAIKQLGLDELRGDRVMDSMVRSLARLTGQKYVSFSVPLENGVQRHIATWGFPAEDGHEATSICALAMAQSKPLAICDLRDDERFAGHHRVLEGMKLRSMLAVPVYSPDNWLVGVLAAAGDCVREFDEDERKDIEDHARVIEQTLLLRNAAVRDELTGLYNRRFFTEQIDKEWRRATRLLLPVSYVLLDIDHFKRINDKFGHSRGDEILRQVARVLDDNLKRAGDTVARYGGEEFAMILPTTSEQDAARLVIRILKIIEYLDIPNPGAPSGKVTVSAGVACAQTTTQVDAATPDFFLQQADEALYAAKQQGRNTVSRYSELDTKNQSVVF